MCTISDILFLATNLPLPNKILGKVNVLTFRFSP